MVLFFQLFVKKKSKAAAEPGRRGSLAFLHFFSLLYDPVQHIRKRDHGIFCLL